MARPTPLVARQGRGRAGAPGWCRSSASARRGTSARPARRWPWSRRSCAARCPEDATATTLVVAYEPVWAIGTGLTPTAADVAEMHECDPRRARRVARQGGRAGVRLLYGGSVKPANAVELMNVAACRRRARRRREPEGRGFLAIARRLLRPSGNVNHTPRRGGAVGARMLCAAPNSPRSSRRAGRPCGGAPCPFS